jgi:hypothetical protein
MIIRRNHEPNFCGDTAAQPAAWCGLRQPVPDRFLRIAVAAALVLLALFVAQPYVTSLMRRQSPCRPRRAWAG